MPVQTSSLKLSSCVYCVLRSLPYFAVPIWRFLGGVQRNSTNVQLIAIIKEYQNCYLNSGTATPNIGWYEANVYAWLEFFLCTLFSSSEGQSYFGLILCSKTNRKITLMFRSQKPLFYSAFKSKRQTLEVLPLHLKTEQLTVFFTN